jgi:putative membrane protein
MRLILVLLVLAFAAAGAIFGALNSETVAYDFYFATWSVPKGAMLIAAVLLGWLLGGALVYFGLVLCLRGRLRAQERTLARTESAAAGSNLSPTDSGLNR